MCSRNHPGKITPVAARWTFLALLFAAVAAPALAADDTAALYQKHCASCHGVDRLGGMGPALLPENLGRLRKGEASKVIAEGRAATQMEGFAKHLDAAQIDALQAYIYTPPAVSPRWDEADIKASHIVHADAKQLPHRPSFKADPMNLFIVVESGDHHVSILDGDTL